MKNLSFPCSGQKKVFLFFAAAAVFAAAGCFFPSDPLMTWTKTFGGSSFERAYAIDQTADGGYILAGQTSSFGSGGYDYYIVKLDESGTVEWQKTFGGASAEIARDVQQTADGGYVVVGRSSSFKTGGCDVYIIKLGSDGTKAWEQVYGDSTWNDPHAVMQTSDGGYIVAGYTGDIGAGTEDVYVMKLDASGEQVWEQTYGGAGTDVANAVRQTTDLGYIVAGYTASSGAGNWDVYLLKMNSSGTVLWEKTIGGTDYDAAEAIVQTADGGYIAAGFTESSGSGGSDMYVVKLDSAGTVTWEQVYGGVNDDHLYAVQQTRDNKFVVAGFSGSADASDLYLAKLDTEGDKVWERSYGGTGDDHAYDIRQTEDRGFVVAGYTHPSDAAASYDDDMYVLKLNKIGSL